MSNTASPSGTESHDDVASLFARLGNQEVPGYRDFSEVPWRRLVQPAAQSAEPVSAREASPASAKPVVARDVLALVPRVESAAPAETPLAALFNRLAAVGGPMPEPSPLTRLRGN